MLVFEAFQLLVLMLGFLNFLGGKCAERNETSGAGNAEKGANGGG